MAVMNQESWARHMRILSMYGITDAREIWYSRYREGGSVHFDVAELGYKCNMTDLTAALGLVQLKKLDWFNRTRQHFANIYDRAFAGHSGISTPAVKEYANTCRHLYPLLLDLEQLRLSRDELVGVLAEANVATSVMFVPLHYHRYYAQLLGHTPGDFPTAENLFSRVLCLPLSPILGEAAIGTVADVVLHLLEKYRR